MLVQCVYMLTLLVIITPTIFANSCPEQGTWKHIVDPRSLVRYFATTTGLDLEPYVEFQKKLEDIADEAQLYDLPEPERITKEKKLLKDPYVQHIIEQCRKLHKNNYCNSTLYRNLDGTCNNLNNPEWGSANFQYDRLLPASYDGINRFRKAVNGGELPSVRSISLKLINNSRTSDYVSAMFVFFGQFVSHDVTHTAAASKNGIPLDCCDLSLKSNPECAPFLIEKDDAYYCKFNVTCMHFARHPPYPSCKLEKRKFMNKRTSFIDGSVIYGNDEMEAQALRLNNSSRRLKMQDSIFGDLLPKNEDPDKLFCPLNETRNCFASGDERANQHTMLIIWQTILPRLHNIIADNLLDLNSNWNEERIYQEARRLVGAILQCIVYREFLPLLVGSDNMKKYNLTIDLKKGSLYDDQVRPNILSEFNTASYRLHSMVPKDISSYQPQTRMADTYSWTYQVHKGLASSLLAGSGEVPSQQNDRFLAEDLSGLLYGPAGSSYGFDIGQFNIKRGRDNGLQPYINIVRECSDKKIEIHNFSDLSQTMTEDNIELLRNIYSDVRDIDGWVGMIMETEINGSVTGPTAACISASQFYRLKFGDRYFFTHTNGRNAFTKEQLQFLEKFSLAQLICATTKDISVIRHHPLKLPGVNNPLVSCQTIRSMNLGAWKEQP